MSFGSTYGVPSRSIMPPGWNGTDKGVQGSFKGGASNGGSRGKANAPSSSPGGAYVWSDASLMLGPIDTGIHTRFLKDAAIIGIAVVLLAIGLILMAEPDFSQIVNTAVKALPEVAA